ncbi:MAG: cytochrome c [Hyphomicrobiales bacterium]|nr:cytochrome c [Hyphomicrobiales bacterium]
MRLLALIGALAIVGALVAAGFFFGGFYDISAAIQDPPALASAIVRVRNASIERHAADRAPANFNDDSRLHDGARAFANAGCVNCHGAPGVKWAKFSEGLNPDPPDLKEVAGELDPSEIFWIVKNGIRMTGMPSFGAAGFGDDEIWSIAAFVKKIGGVSDADFAAWTSPPASPPPAAASPPQAPPAETPPPKPVAPGDTPKQ